MGILSSLLGVHAERYAPDHDFWYSPVGGQTASGMRVGATEALSASPVWGATRLLADSVATLPLRMYRYRPDGGKERAANHALEDLLHHEPNSLQTSLEFRRVLMVHALLWGNGYARIMPGLRGPVDQLIPMHPDGVRVVMHQGQRVYKVRTESGTEETLGDEQVFHLAGLSLDGVTGLSIMRMARESIGVNLAAKQYSAEFFGQGGRPSGVLQHPGKLTPSAVSNIRESWQEIHGGIRGMRRPAILAEGMEWKSTGMTSNDAQLLGLLEWSAADVARYFNVPLHMIQETSKVTSWGSGISELSLGFVTYSLLPWLIHWQERIRKDLILAKQSYFAEFTVDALLRGNTKERYEAYSIAAGGPAPWMTRNEIRERENMNPLDGADELLMPLNMGKDGVSDDAVRTVDANIEWVDSAANAYLSLMTREAAARVVRREIGALCRLAERHSVDRPSFDAAVHAFYHDHPAWVIQVLHLDDATVREYCHAQLCDVLAHGPDAMDGWDPERVDYLTGLALAQRGIQAPPADSADRRKRHISAGEGMKGMIR